MQFLRARGRSPIIGQTVGPEYGGIFADAREMGGGVEGVVYPWFGLDRLVTYAVWVMFAASAVIFGIVYGLEDPEEQQGDYDRSMSEREQGAIYSALFAEVRFGKTQQWYVAYYALLLLAGIVGLTRLSPVFRSPLLMDWILPLLADSIWGMSVIAVLVFQRSQRIARIRQNRVPSFQRQAYYWMDDESFDDWRMKSDRYSLHVGWLLLFISVVTIGWFAVEYLLLLSR